MDTQENNLPSPVKKASFFKALRATLWSFLGLRNSKSLDQDANELTPIQLIVAGFVCLFIFVGLLMFFVKSVVS